VFTALAQSLVDAIEAVLGKPADLKNVIGLSVLAILEVGTKNGFGSVRDDPAAIRIAAGRERDRCAVGCSHSTAIRAEPQRATE
jgi:hypothetical protein